MAVVFVVAATAAAALIPLLISGRANAAVPGVPNEPGVPYIDKIFRFEITCLLGCDTYSLVSGVIVSLLEKFELAARED